MLHYKPRVPNNDFSFNNRNWFKIMKISERYPSDCTPSAIISRTMYSELCIRLVERIILGSGMCVCFPSFFFVSCKTECGLLSLNLSGWVHITKVANKMVQLRIWAIPKIAIY